MFQSAERDLVSDAQGGGAAVAKTVPTTARPSLLTLLRGGGIGYRLLALILLFSSAVTLISTVLQLYFDYRRDVSAIESRLDEIERSYLDSLAGSLWNVDTEQLRIQLDGILKLPDMQAVEVRETTVVDHPLLVTAGQRQSSSVLTRTIPLLYRERGESAQIGVLYAEATLTGVYRRLLDTTMVILISQGIKTFLVSLFILYIVFRLVTRHLMDFAEHVGGFDLRSPSPAIVLHRQAPAHADELDQVVGAFNAMSAGLRQAYDELSTVNAELEADIAARRLAECEVMRLNASLEQRVHQRTAELEAANQELGAFTYSVSHDLRAPLRRIEGFGQILVAEYADRFDERGSHYLDRIRAGARDMGDMIDSFLTLSRSTRGELTIEHVDLSAMAQDIVARLHEKEPDRTISIDIQPALGVDGDRRLLRAALDNLFDNAWKYSRGNETTVIAFGAHDEAGHTVYFIRDNGAGFDMKYADRLCTPFTRLHRAEEFEGSGIGLATVQRILARHGGRIWAAAADPGQGATFHFTCWEGKPVNGQS